MGACESACCGQDTHNVDTNKEQISAHGEGTTLKPTSQANLFELMVKDEKQVRKLEELMSKGVSTAALTREICSDPKATLQLLSKLDKSMDDYENLCLKDAELLFKAIEDGSLKYYGQVRLLPVYSRSEMSNTGRNYKGVQQGTTPEGGKQADAESVVDYEYQKCGYGKLVWPDGNTFEGFWINGQACGVGVFRASEHMGGETYEGFWQQDRQTNLCVFRQNVGFDIQQDLEAIESQSEITTSQHDKQNGKGIEVWSDGSYYHGNFKGGVKEGNGCYFWADGSKYTGSWSNDEMSGTGCFQWADGRYFQGNFQNGVMHGYGNYVWQDGRKYEGHYKFNKKHGSGTYTYSDGSKYRGDWVDGMQHGVGFIIDAESTYERQGIWAFGKLKQWIKPEN